MRNRELQNQIQDLESQVRYLTWYIQYREQLTEYNKIPNSAKPYVTKPQPPYRPLNKFNLKSRPNVTYTHIGRDLGDLLGGN